MLNDLGSQLGVILYKDFNSQIRKHLLEKVLIRLETVFLGELGKELDYRFC